MLQVPQIWAKVAYPCLKPLGSWFKDYLRRVAFMRTWLTEGQPSCFWLPGFFFPQGFLTGVLQVHARKYTIPIDTLAFQFSVTNHPDAAEVCPQNHATNIVVDKMTPRTTSSSCAQHWGYLEQHKGGTVPSQVFGCRCKSLLKMAYTSTGCLWMALAGTRSLLVAAA